MEAESKHLSVKELEVSGGLYEVLEGEKKVVEDKGGYCARVPYLGTVKSKVEGSKGSNV